MEIADARSDSTDTRGVDRERVKAQMRRWQDRVLDLTKSNPLIGLNRSRVAKLAATDPDSNALFTRFVVEETQLRMPLVRKRRQDPQQHLLLRPDEDPDFVIEPGDVTLDANAPELMRRLRRIHDNARTTLEERGVTTLHLTFGALRWKDELLGESVSPLWMVPCVFESKGPDAPLRLCLADEDAQLNPALEYYLRERHKIELPELPDEVDTQSLVRVLRSVRRKVQEQNWDVTDEVWLSTFSFESLVIYRDLRALLDTAMGHPIIAALSRATPSRGKSEALPHDLDSLPTPTTVPIPVLPTDSSQLEALTLSSLGHHVVVHGPPGTGKSQTIANLVADALARNRKVLFVSAKMAALNVVYDRLKELGLQRFCLEAHSTKAGKQKIIDELRRTLEADTNHDGDSLERELQALLLVRQELNAYARELHAPVQPLGLSVYRANARLAQLQTVADVRGSIPWANVLDVRREDLDQCVPALEELASSALVFDNRATHPWFGFSPSRFGLGEQEDLEAALRSVAALNAHIQPRAALLEDLISGARAFSISEWPLLRGVLAALADTERLPSNWWQQDQQALLALSHLFAEAAEEQREYDSLSADIHGTVVATLTEIGSLLAPIQSRFAAWDPFIRASYWQEIAEAVGATDRLPAHWSQQSEDGLNELSHTFLGAAERCKEQQSLSEDISAVIEGAPADLAKLLAPIGNRFGRWHDYTRPSYWRWRKQVQAALRPGVQFEKRRIEILNRKCARAFEIECWFNKHRPGMEPYVEHPELTNPAVLTEAAASFAIAALCRQGVRANAEDDIIAPVASIEIRDLADSILLWQKEMRATLRPEVEFTRERVQDLDARCRRVEDIQRWFDQKRAVLDSYVDPQPTLAPATLTGMSRSFAVAGLCKQVLAALGKETMPLLTLRPDFRTAAKELLGEIPVSSSAVPSAFHRLDEGWPSGFAGGALASRASLAEVAGRAESLLSSMSRAREWVLLNRALHQCASRDLSAFVDSLGSVSASDAPRAFERRFLRLWVSDAVDKSRALSGFTEAKGRDLIEKHRNLDDRVRRLAVARAQMTASAASVRVRAAEDLPESASEVGILRRELQKRKRIKPLRKLFAEIPHVLQALKPCLLMSPISVSTYLKPDVFHFDLVVFDEASQLPTAEAVPSILRASQVVVAGDPKQLPPTSFFEALLVPEEEENDDDDGASGQIPLESLLDDCVAVVPVFQESHLRWHYRSRDERLIKFSNHFFYDNKLITFPAANPTAAGQGVRFLHVPDGVYDRGRSRTNRVEAGAVAKLALGHFDSYPERSLGIVALNLSQKEAIEDAIAEALLARPDLATFFEGDRHENVFIKSLENVQGDERDTMIISVGYGRDYSGGLSMNFGPINAEGGWRRLNVLVTRAKWECILVSSLRSHDLSGVNPNNRGAVSLRSFLDFAERDSELPMEGPPPDPNPPEANDFEEAVRAALLNRGLKVDMQVGASRYRIDLAVRDPRDERRYLLGIECDGRTYHSSRTARDRDLLRQLVLQRMGWRIHRVWSTEWFHNPEQAVAEILKSVEQAKQAPIEHPVFAPPADPDPPEPERNPPLRQGSDTRELPRKHKPGQPYSVFQSSRRLTRDYLIHSSGAESLAGTITDLVRVEGPIHRDLLLERLKVVHGVARAGSNVQANVERALQMARRDHAITHDSGSPFYYVPGSQVDYFRLPNDLIRRPIEHIAPVEISLSILYLVEDQFGIIEESLPAAVARLFGIERLHTDAAEPIRRVVEDLVSRGSLRRSGMQVHLA